MTFRKKTTRLVTRSFAPFVVSSASSSSPASCATCSPFDQTRGGYEPPYTGYSGTPIDWTTLDVTADGMAHRGHVVNVLIDCTSGMMSFEVFKLEMPFRGFSPRAIAVHKPREACEARGFQRAL